MDKQLSLHTRLLRLEHNLLTLEERESANLRRIEQLAARVRELEMARGELAAEHWSPAVITAEEMRQRLDG